MNPYEVLGVSPSASQEEIRAAYMKLVKKYHPDRYQDSALKEQAEEKMKKINAAYDMLTKQKKDGAGYSQSQSHGQSGSYGQSGTYGQSYGQYRRQQYTGQYEQEFMAVRRLINGGDIQGALNLLSTIPLKNAEWVFLYGMCCYRNGQYSRAYEYVSRACQMDPNNAEYASALAGMRGASEKRASWTENGRAIRTCGIISSVFCANVMCRFCCY